MDKKKEVSVIIPAYNEAEGIKDTLMELMDRLPDAFEILVIDDGSTDDTYKIVKNIAEEYEQVRCVAHGRNRGYGSAIKTGCKHVESDIVVWYDADGQHRPEDLFAVVDKLKSEGWDYCIGARTKESHCDKDRKLGKAILSGIVNMLAKETMPDFNSGLRAFRRDVLLKYLSLLPKRFGASTVTSFIMQEENCLGGVVPIVVRKRVGTSTVKPVRDAIRTLSLIFDIILLFRPLEIFGVAGGGMIVVGIIYGIIEALLNGMGIPVLAAILMIFGLQVFCFGIISAQISKLRLEKYNY